MISSKVYCFLIVLLSFYASTSIAQDYQVNYLSVEDGLSQNEVTSIVQDKYGFMWFGTRGGLNRFDGYDFKHYKPSLSNKNSIPNPSIESLFLDSANNELWIGLKSGGPVNYDLSLNVFQRHEIRRLNRILSFFKDDEGNIWIGSWNNGLVCIGKDETKMYRNNNQVRRITQSKDGTIWITSINGLKCKRKGDENFSDVLAGGVTSLTLDQDSRFLWVVGWTINLTRINISTLEKKEYSTEQTEKLKLYTVLNDNQDKLLIGTWGDGLYHFDKQKETFKIVDELIEGVENMSSELNVIRSMFKDNVGDIWLGTHAGVVRLAKKNKFNFINNFDDGGLLRPHVNAMLVDKNGHIWAGTNGDGLYFSKGDNKFEELAIEERYRSNKELIIKAIDEDLDRNVWVSFEGGLFIASKSVNGAPYVVPASIKLRSPDLKRVRKAHELLFDGTDLWVGTQQNGVLLFKKKKDTYHFVRQFSRSGKLGAIGDDRVTAIKKASDGKLWFATYKGLYTFNSSDSTFLSIQEMGVTSPLVCDIVLCLEFDHKGDLWFGTPCSLNRLRFVTSNLTELDTYTKEQGLADDYVNGLIEDDNGLLWFSTSAGISSFNIDNGQILNFDRADGIGDASYSEGACFKDGSGQLYFGGHSSLTYFNPAHVQINNYNPPIVFTEFSILNKNIAVTPDGIISTDINEVAEIELTHNEMAFSFKIASLDYKAAHKNQYAYRLLGADDQWQLYGSQREIAFNNLKPGEYELQLKGTNSNGIWSDNIRSLKLTILPPPWKSIYAIMAYVVFIMLLVIIIIRTAIRQERLQNKVEIEKVQNEQIKQINDYKLRFFTNISHEFRTPLTLILAPVKELLSRDFADVRPAFYNGRLSMINDNVKRLYDLVNQLLEFRKMEAGKLSLAVAECNLQEVIANNCRPFEQLSKINSIDFKCVYKAHEDLVFVDNERISVVLTNLLGNAFKHVSESGQVLVNVTDDEDYYKIDVSNDGKKIPKEEIDNLFERFYQVAGSSTVGSSGIGLQLVKSFIELHRGTVSIKSEENEPICFTIRLKKGKSHFSENEFVKSKKETSLNLDIINPPVKKAVNKGTIGAKILVVDDNAEIRDYLSQFLGEYYQVIEASDGFEGFDKAVENLPDLILSDVMMPRMDGYELCEKIKTSEILSHIPIVLLTAKGSESEQLFGTQKGADLYVKKPFVPELLLEEIKQLIASRKHLKEKFSNKIVLEATEEEISSNEAEFLKQCVKVTEKNLKRSDFTPEVLANELAMSSSTFYRRIKASAQLTPAGFIKSIRLKKAAQLLKDTDLVVSEVIERVGYLDSRSFRKNFKEFSGMSPMDYRKNKGH